MGGNVNSKLKENSKLILKQFKISSIKFVFNIFTETTNR